MKAPDKIYINVTPLGVDYSIVPIPDFGGVEYIRKDALLEWAEKELNKAKLTDFDDFGRDEVMTWVCIIDKINSL